MNMPQDRIIYLLVSLFFFCQTTLLGQSTTKIEKMEALSFMVGDWVRTSKVYKDGQVDNEVPAFQKISYDLNKHIIVIELQSKLLQLHTIIYYDEESAQYVYNPYSERGVRKSPASLKDGKFVVAASETNRFVFSRTSKDTFQEYGKKLTDGEWTRYFEDNFKDIQ